MIQAILLLVACSLTYAADVADLARAAAPEFFADAVLKLVENGKVPDREKQIPLLEEAFAAAAGAQQPTPVAAVFGTLPETRATYQSRASELGLDALSLQSRAVKVMLAVNREKARELFRRVHKPAVPAHGCEDPLVADVSAYYEIASAVAESRFAADDLQALLAGVRSPSEVLAFTRMLESADLKPADWESLLGSLAAKLGEIEPDSRAFARTIAELRALVASLAGRARVLGLPTGALSRSFRMYLIGQMTAPRCNQEFDDAKQAVRWFNTFFTGDQPRIFDEEIQPSQPAAAPKADSYFVSEDSKPLGEALTQLQFLAEGRPRSPADRSTAEWRDLLAVFLRDWEAWRPPGSAVDVLHQKAYVLRAAFDLAPPGDGRERILNLFVTLLESSDARQQSPAEWLWQVARGRQSTGADASKLIQAFRDSGDPGLVWYATAFP